MRNATGSFLVSGVYLVCFIGPHITKCAVFTHDPVPYTALALIGVYIRLNGEQRADVGIFFTLFPSFIARIFIYLGKKASGELCGLHFHCS